MTNAQPLGQMIIELGLDNTNFSKGMKGVNQQVKTSMTEMKAHLNVIGRTGNEVDILKAKQMGLSGVMQAQTEKVQLAKENYEACKEAVEGNSEATQAQKDALVKSQNEYVKAIGELGSYERQLKTVEDQLRAVDTKILAASTSVFKIGAEFEKSGKKITAFGGGISNVGKRITGIGESLTNKITKPAAAAATALVSITLVKGFNRLVGIDNAKAKLLGLGHDAESITKIMESALASVKGTAFGMDEAVTTAAGASAAGVKSGEELTRYLSLVGDTAAIAGASMSDMGSIINKVQTAQVAYTDNLNQLADRGLPIYQWIGEAAGVAASEVKDMASKGQISSELFLEAIEKNIGGAAKVMGESSFTAALSNIWASVGRIGANFLDAGGKGGGFFSTLKPMLTDFNKSLGTLEDNAAVIGVKFGEAFQEVIKSGESLKAKFDSLSPSTQALILKITVMSIVLGPVIIGIGKLVTGIGTGVVVMGKMVTGTGKAMQAIVLWAAKVSGATAATTAQTVATTASTAATNTNTISLAASTIGIAARTVKTTLSVAAEKTHTLVLMAANGVLIQNAAALNASILAKTKSTAATITGGAAEKAHAAIMLITSGTLSVQTVKMGVLTVATAAQTTITNICTVATGALGAALKLLLGPVGWIIAGITLLVTGIVALVKHFTKESEASKELKKDTEELAKAHEELAGKLSESKKSYEDNIGNIKAEASASKELTKRIEDLLSIENKSASQKRELETYVNQLNKSVEGLNLTYDEQANSLNMTTDAVYEQISALEKQAEKQAAAERLTEIFKEQIITKEQMAQVQDKLTEANENSSLKEGERKKIVEELTGQEKMLEEQLGSLVASEEYTSNAIKEMSAESANAVKESIETQIITWEDLSETQQSVVESLKTNLQSYTDAATDMFEKINTKSKISVSKMIENLEHNQKAVANWSEGITKLAERGVNEGLLETLRKAGPESAGTVAALVAASDNELKKLSETFANGGTTATDALKNVFNTSEIPQSVMGMVTQTQTTLSQAIKSADFASLGADTINGYTKGIDNNLSNVVTTAKAIGKTAEETTKGYLGIQSPSRLFTEIGEYTIQGFTQGIMKEQVNLGTVMRLTMQATAKIATDTMQNELSQLTIINTNAFSGLSQATLTGMTGINNVITNAMATTKLITGTNLSQILLLTIQNLTSLKAQYSLNFIEIINDTRTKMGSVKAVVSSDINALKTSFNSGMNQIVQVTKRGMSSVVSTCNIYNEMYEKGQNAGEGFKSGLSSKEASIYATANAIAENVVRTITKALDIHSPSRVMLELGQYTMQGFGKGLENMQEYVGNIVTDTTKIVTKGFETPIIGRATITTDSEAIQKMNKAALYLRSKSSSATENEVLGSKEETTFANLIDSIISKIVIEVENYVTIGNAEIEDVVSNAVIKNITKLKNNREKSEGYAR